MPIPRPLHVDASGRRVPNGLHALTAIHGLGAVATLVMGVGSLVSLRFRDSLIQSPGSELMVQWFGDATGWFLLFICAWLSALSWGSWHLRPWTWPLTLVAYSIGVAGSLWEVSIGIWQAWASAAINAGVVAYALSPRIRQGYGRSRSR